MSKITNDGLTRSGIDSCTRMATVGVKGLRCLLNDEVDWCDRDQLTRVRCNAKALSPIFVANMDQFSLVHATREQHCYTVEVKT